ncbi:tRNA threonylcarbamoyladenosine biosynthesis protein TsaB [Caminicella sporogenes DSM 14501]|uniref:tRNA threonylcarbamoyladenosine biosynthesis protein TsaB n=1 Tax=Caminicella sporogenes DSM 14501 TaxID=1121266 RepID=A0A1M6Q5C2_9FIRM|nr:tRNA (adenosine(37)-N6)-threonylcarbamoyltransferase complex dimerization subunit type 1 TsaB [Caminicella sporogenes]RKD23577.1 tRNA N6-adenosine(37)-N6-threonylcarbamoyltransferase complex dimerization subunit TsaB [Caminicella sporogenes]SHK15316.1 tRNA threonylcarbamoyladenosine biosynthesis protein TsaB [Caminicella sporogenes DSM 14501]
MNILAIDTSSLVATVAVINEEKLLGEYTINTPMTHSQKLMPIIDELMKQLDLKMDDIDLIAVSRGPGSFTGIRIGVATAKGLAHPNNIPIIGISSLEGLASNIPFSEYLICPIMDARRNQVYTGVYKWEENKLNNIVEEAPLTIKELTDILLKRKEKVIFLGDGLNRYGKDIIDKFKDKAILAPQYISMQRASSIGQLAFNKVKNGDAKLKSYLDIVPVYLRKSEAERQYEEKMKRCLCDEES